jgi:hypothetical protein
MNYVRALEHAVARLTELPVCLRLNERNSRNLTAEGYEHNAALI